MDVDLSPKLAKKFLGEEGGSYYVWSSTEVPMLGAANLGAGKLVPEPLGLAMPHYADSAKIGYVLQGRGRVGIIMPEASEEKVVEIKKGDAIVVPFGAVSWWFNDGSSELVVLFLGDTSKAHTPAMFTYFFLTGASGIFNGFSSEFISMAWDLKKEEANKLIKSQSAQLIIKLNEGIQIPNPSKVDTEKMVFNLEDAPFNVDINNAGRMVVLTSANFPLLKEIRPEGVSANLVKLYSNAMCSPGFSSDSAIQLTYVIKGSGRVQVVGTDGRQVLDTKVAVGSLFIVPRFLIMSKIADSEGMEWFSFITILQPVFSQLAGKTSVWKALPPQILEASLNVTPDLVKLFRSKRCNDTIFFQPN